MDPMNEKMGLFEIGGIQQLRVLNFDHLNSTSFKWKTVKILHTNLPFFHLTKGGLSTDHLLTSCNYSSDFRFQLLKKMA